MDILKETDFGFLGPKTAGKVRDIYERNGKLVLITTESISRRRRRSVALF
jgi:hypothetical protein